MARHLPLLDATPRRAFDQPPTFNRPPRQLFFALPDWATQFLQTLLAPHSRGGFVAQVGYFKATGRFFPADRFVPADRDYVQQRYHLGNVGWERYDKATRFHHRQQILQQFGVLPFEQAEAALLAWLQTPDVLAFAQLRQTAQQLREGGGGSTSGPYYQLIAERSRRLQHRLGEILRTVAYEGAADSPLAQALAQYRARDGQIGSQPPTAFLKAAERVALQQADSPASLYKALLAGHVADHLKAGKLNLAHSLRYRPFDTHLLDAAVWERQRDELLVQTNPTHLREPGPWPAEWQAKLATAFARSFERLDAGINPGVRQRPDGRPRFLTPARPVEEDAPTSRPLFPGPGLISLHEVLHTVNQQCHFTDCLEHWSPRHRPPRPAERVFFAGLMAYGCNLGLTRMAHAAKHVPLATLENTVNGYFPLDDLHRANDAVVALIGKLPVSRLSQRHPEAVHTSSDGQKYYAAVDSIHATYSYK